MEAVLERKRAIRVVEQALNLAGFMALPGPRSDSLELVIAGQVARLDLRRRRYTTRRSASSLASAVPGEPTGPGAVPDASRGPACRLKGSTQSFISASAASTNIDVRDLPIEAA
jgi:hypothetical protein